eukprot:TRINITY_DN5193_c0_g1_i1.p1 TRINITY_DN5193_c0_g1~~TRINITY_DN5193_c0_g1_i1.p1  ORF type:complete len:356 (+),score=125.49 TRINITY_DN5193_c0_g1_i1:121-1188(+)
MSRCLWNRLPVLSVFVGIFAVASGAALHRQRSHGGGTEAAAVDAAADLDAEAVIAAAEKETPETAPPAQATQLAASSANATANVTKDGANSSGPVTTAAKKDEDSDDGKDEDDDEEEEDDDKEKSTGSPGSLIPMMTDPGESKTLDVSYGVTDGVLRGESLTPQGRLTKARQRLQDNIYQQTKINSLIWQMQNETAFQTQVDSEAAELASETQAQALARMLGGMRKEMRKFASPFFLDHLYSERKRLKEAEVTLQAELDASEGDLGGGHQGWPHPGDKVVVAESTFRRPSASLRGGAEGESAPASGDSEVKHLKIDIQKDTSLAQTKKVQPEKSAAVATSLAGAGAALLVTFVTL